MRKSMAGFVAALAVVVAAACGDGKGGVVAPAEESSRSTPITGGNRLEGDSVQASGTGADTAGRSGLLTGSN